MRALALLTTLPLALLAACGADDAAPSVSDDLRADLRLASSGSMELASAVRGDSMVVSAIERTPARAASPAATPRRSATPRVRVPRPVPEATPEPAPDPAPAAATEEPEVIAEAPAPSDLPAATRPVPVSFPSGGGEGAEGARGGDGPGMGEVVGTVIGVVIRGGGVGDDHCIPRTRRGRGRPGPVLTGIPGRTGGLPSPTFPGRTRF
ncbi:MAG TPA: hypothetical protein VFZ11_14740 [Gemmatimonadaceae bacterium]